MVGRLVCRSVGRLVGWSLVGRKRIGLKGMEVPWGGVKLDGRSLLAGLEDGRR